MNMLESVRVHESEHNVILVKSMDGADLQYFNDKGVMVLGQLWKGKTPEGVVVRFFLPIPSGMPFVLGVDLSESVIVPEDMVKPLVDTIENMGNDAPVVLKQLWGRLVQR